jgi:20S proteasome subunit alpha 7
MVSKMLVAGSNRRVFGVDSNLGVAVTGLSADGRQLVNKAREEAQSYKDTYGHKVRVGVSVTDRNRVRMRITCNE